MLAGARHETWTDVRRADVAALGELCTPAADEALQLALKRDVDEVREVALAGIAHCYGVKANPALIHILGRLPESADMRALAARLLAERRDPATVPGLAAALARLVKEVEADLSLAHRRRRNRDGARRHSHPGGDCRSGDPARQPEPIVQARRDRRPRDSV